MRYIQIIRSSNLGMGFSLDSRGYLLLTMLLQDDQGQWNPLPAGARLTCEYLEDLASLAAFGVTWVQTHCDEIRTENRHLYWKFKESHDAIAVG